MIDNVPEALHSGSQSQRWNLIWTSKQDTSQLMVATWVATVTGQTPSFLAGISVSVSLIILPRKMERNEVAAERISAQSHIRGPGWRVYKFVETTGSLLHNHRFLMRLNLDTSHSKGYGKPCGYKYSLINRKLWWLEFQSRMRNHNFTSAVFYTGDDLCWWIFHWYFSGASRPSSLATTTVLPSFFVFFAARRPVPRPRWLVPWTFYTASLYLV